MSWSLRLTLWFAAALLSFNLCFGTGLITGGGHWFSPHTAYRQQTDALLAGRFALSYSPTAIVDDLVWAEGSVQQVWGLGVPFWRLPLEVLARLFGQQAFPDRIALALAILLVSYLVLRVFTVPDNVKTLDDWLVQAIRSPVSMAAAILAILFPPVITLCRGPFNVYEEAVVYGFYLSIGLFAATIGFASRPNFRLYLTLSLLAGLAAFIRPTMGAYGLATLVVTGVVARRAGWSWVKVLSGPALFVLGGALLFWTNHVRFGSGFEFGHQLTRTALYLMYLLRFPTPINDEPLWSAAKELVGWLFFASDRETLGPWQSPTPRWRELYHSTFDWSYLVVVLLCWTVMAWHVASSLNRRAALPNRELTVAAFWSLISLTMLFVFYLRLPTISSRYILDFAPGICVTFIASLRAIEHWSSRAPGPRKKKLIHYGVTATLVIWGIYQVSAAKHYSLQTPIFTKSEVIAQLHESTPDFRSIPAFYTSATNPANLTGIPHNGAGWTPPKGYVDELVVLFVEDPDRLRIEVVPAEGADPTEEQYTAIRAKVGLEFLDLESIQSTTHGRVLTFAPPKRQAYRDGIQIVHIAFLPPDEFMNGTSRFRLLRVDWRDRPFSTR